MKGMKRKRGGREEEKGGRIIKEGEPEKGKRGGRGRKRKRNMERRGRGRRGCPSQRARGRGPASPDRLLLVRRAGRPRRVAS